MTTATDWDVQDAETGEHPIVTDVTTVDGAATDAPALSLDDAHRAVVRNAELTQQLRRAEAEAYRLNQMLETLVAEVSELRAELHPLDPRRTGWTPGPKAMPRTHWTQVHGVDDLTEQQQRAALVAPTLPELRDGDEHYSGAPLAAELMAGVDAKPGWPTWLGQVHHADAAWADIVTRLRAMPDTYAAAPVERTVVDRVEISDSYAETRYKVKLMHAGLTKQASVYDELAPDKITQDSPADESGQNREATSPTTPERASGRGSGAETTQSPLNGPDDRQPSPPGALVPTGAPDEYPPPEHERQGQDPDLTPEHERQPDDRVQRMTEQRRRRDTLATRSNADDAVPTPQRRPWWTRYGDLIAGAAIGVAAFAALGVAWVTGVL